MKERERLAAQPIDLLQCKIFSEEQKAVSPPNRFLATIHIRIVKGPPLTFRFAYMNIKASWLKVANAIILILCLYSAEFGKD
jgi:hypothetical protein